MHAAMGPTGESAIIIFNPGQAQTITIDLSQPASLLGRGVWLHDLFELFGGGNATAALNKEWAIPMKASEMKAFCWLQPRCIRTTQGQKVNLQV